MNPDTSKQRSDGATTKVLLGSCSHTLEHGDFTVALISHGSWINECFQYDMLAATQNMSSEYINFNGPFSATDFKSRAPDN